MTDTNFSLPKLTVNNHQGLWSMCALCSLAGHTIWKVLWFDQLREAVANLVASCS
ncbi:MAG: hypothetical protein ACI8P9_004915, partial [Parasphingorhabdus sp.]